MAGEGARKAYAVIATAWIVIFSTAAVAADGAWSTKTPMPTAREGMATGVIAAKLYAASGCCRTFASPFTRFSEHEVYDAATNSWSAVAPILRALYLPATGVISGKLYVAGGQASPSEGSNLAILQVYDPATNSWANKQPMPFATSAAAGAVIDGKLYVAGGMNPSNTAPTNTLRVYDTVTDQWTTKANMPTVRAMAAAVAIGGKLYVVGGSNVTPFGTLEVYDPATDTWATRSPMPTPRGAHGAAAMDGLLYAVGGHDNVNHLSTVEAYDSATDTWSTKPPMPTARALLGVEVVNGVLYAAGGAVDGTTVTNVVEAYTVFVQFGSFAAKAQIQLNPAANDDRFAVEARFRLGARSNGINPPIEVVTLELGTGRWSIPPGSFKSNGFGGYVFQGFVGTTALGVAIQPLRDGSFAFVAAGAQAEVTGTANPVPISLTIGDDAGTTSVVATFVSPGARFDD